MNGSDAPTEIDASLLAEAFPASIRATALRGAALVAGRVTSAPSLDRFAVDVEGQIVRIPVRLYFRSDLPLPPVGDEARLVVRALQTRSTDGFERQRAARELLQALPPWGAPFIVALIGEYVVEILDDIDAAMTPETAQTLRTFIAANPRYWQTIQRRVTSYWNVYYRYSDRSDGGIPFRRWSYIGFRLIDRLEAGSSIPIVLIR